MVFVYCSLDFQAKFARMVTRLYTAFREAPAVEQGLASLTILTATLLVIVGGLVRVQMFY